MFRYRWQQHSIVLQRTDGGEISTCHPSSLLPGITIILSRYLCSLLASRNVFSERIPGKRINKPYKIAAVLSMKHENCVRKFQDITNSAAAWCITGEDGISSLSTGEPHHNMVRVWLVGAVWAGYGQYGHSMGWGQPWSVQRMRPVAGPVWLGTARLQARTFTASTCQYRPL